MIIIKGILEPGNPHFQLLAENTEDDYYYSISGGIQEGEGNDFV